MIYDDFIQSISFIIYTQNQNFIIQNFQIIFYLLKPLFFLIQFFLIVWFIFSK